MNIKLKKQIICFPYHLLNAILAMSLMLLTDIEYNILLYFFIWITLCTYDLTIARNYKKKYKQILYDTKPTKEECFKQMKGNYFLIENKFYRIIYSNHSQLDWFLMEDKINNIKYYEQANDTSIYRAKKLVEEFLYKPETRIDKLKKIK